MKDTKVVRTFVRPSVLIGAAACIGCLLFASPARSAPVNLLKFSLTNGTATVMPSDNSLGGVSVSLTTYNGSGTARDLNGLPGSGVNGLVTGAKSLCLTNGDTGNATQSANANAAANSAVDLGDATLAFGTITNWVVTTWINEPIVYSDASGNTLPRLFVLSSSASPGANEDTLNSIGVKFQLGNQFELVVNNATTTTGNSYNAPANTATLGTTLASDMLASKWYFVAWVYDGTNIYQFTGSDTAVATLQNQLSAPGLSVSLGNPSSLVLGNRNWKGVRGYFGSMEDFRFYTGVSTNNASFVESIRKELAPKIPTITGIYPDGTALMQATNKLVFNAQSASGFNITNISLVLNGVDVSSGCTFVTNGTGSTNVSVSYTGLSQQAINTAVMTARDSIALAGTATVTFDTYNPTNFIIEAEEFDFGSGQFIDNPDYTDGNPADANSYYGLDSVELVDTHKGGAASGANDPPDAYRHTDGSGTRTQTPVAAGELALPKFNGLVDGSSTPIVNHMVSLWSSAEWQNYTKTFPSGSYNVYARLSTSSGSTILLDQVTSGRGTVNQTLANLGSFTLTGNGLGVFQWVPLLKNGTLAVVNLAGVNTVRATSGGGAAADLYMLVPANNSLPVISGVYPDGQFLFEPTNKLAFTVSSASSTISTANIQVTLNGSNVSSGLVFTGGPSTWQVSYSGLQVNQTYATVIHVTDNSSASTTATLTMDTWNPILQVEAEDFDFNPALSPVNPNAGNPRFIDNPVPTSPHVAAANSYEGQTGAVEIDEHGTSATGHADWRPTDATATPAVTDTARRQFGAANALDYNVGFLGPGQWQQYTKTWPSGTFNLYGRMASGANLGTLYSSWSQVIAGGGTTNQITRHVGSFPIPSTNGYSSYLYTPLMDRFGNYAQLTLGGQATFRNTELVFNQTETANGAVFGLNLNFFMLVAARTDQARIDNVVPDGTTLMQPSGFSFVASSPTYGINTTNIHVTLNGADISSQLVFSGSSASWNVSYPGLQANKSYTAVITVTDAANQTRTTTVSFDTFNPNNFTWEAEDFDFDPANSPVSNGSGLRYIDNPAPTSNPATNSYLGQVGTQGIDESSIFFNVLGTYVYRPLDFVSTEVTSDALRPKYQAAQLQNVNPYIRDYDVNFWTNNAWLNYTRTFPSGKFYLYGRLAAGNGAFSMACAQVTSGAGTSTQTTNLLGNFIGTGSSFATWQYVQLVNTNTGAPIVLNLGGVETLQMSGDYNENANFFMLVPVAPTITATVTGSTIHLSFPTQSGFTFTVYYKNNLTDPTWTPLGSVPGNGSTQSVPDTISGTSRLYRVGVQ